jgi:hypothetical protein
MDNLSLAKIIILVLIVVLWLGVGNLIVLDSLRRQKLSLTHLFNPFLIGKLQLKDWLKLFVLLLVVAGLALLMVAIDQR